MAAKKCISRKLDDIVNKCNNTYHRTIKMKHVDVKSTTYIDFEKNNAKKDPKFKVSDHVKISKYKNIFAFYVPYWCEEVFVIKKGYKYSLVILKVKKSFEYFTKK